MFSGCRILLVDDDPGVLQVCRLLLEDLGCTVEPQGSPQAALRRCDGGMDDFDLLITDVVMPGLSGVELAERLRRQRSGLPVIFLSAHSEGLIPGGARTRFLAKPFQRNDLARMIGELVELGPGNAAASGC